MPYASGSSTGKSPERSERFRDDPWHCESLTRRASNLETQTLGGVIWRGPTTITIGMWCDETGALWIPMADRLVQLPFSPGVVLARAYDVVVAPNSSRTWPCPATIPCNQPATGGSPNPLERVDQCRCAASHRSASAPRCCPAIPKRSGSHHGTADRTSDNDPHRAPRALKRLIASLRSAGRCGC